MRQNLLSAPEFPVLVNEHQPSLSQATLGSYLHFLFFNSHIKFVSKGEMKPFVSEHPLSILTVKTAFTVVSFKHQGLFLIPCSLVFAIYLFINDMHMQLY